MFRKGFTTPQPSQGRIRKVAKQEATKNGSSLVSSFDQITRNCAVLQEGAEDTFLKFVIGQAKCRERWEVVETQIERVTKQLEDCEAEVTKLEIKLGQARDLLSVETTARKKAEQERDQLYRQLDSVKEVLSKSATTGSAICGETWARLNNLGLSLSSRRSTPVPSPCSVGGLSPVLRMTDSTCSILDASDLSFDKSADILGMETDTTFRSGRVYKRKSSGGGAALAAAKREKRMKNSPGQIISLEAAAAKRNAERGQYKEHTLEVTLEDTVIPRQTIPNSQDSSMSPDPHIEVDTLVFQPSKPVRRTNSINRPHQFVQKNNFCTETCGPCQHRIQFGKLCYKCSECGGVSHPQCKDKLTLPCVPPGKASTKTGSKSSPNDLGTWSLSDHSPESSPMVPTIMVHCILEIERRGLGEIGLYRIPSSRREVKHLRDKFLTGRGCPNLETTDVHVLCGTVKEFLCSLKEPLIPSSLWKTFTSVATNPDSTDAESDLFLAVCELPQPNRDTLAFLILHLQRIAANKETRMNRSNLAKILGPTVIGYSSMDAEPEDIMKEVDIQEVTLERLISIDHSPGTPQMIHPSSTLWNHRRDSATNPTTVNRRNLDKGAPTDNIFASPQMY